MTVPCCVCQAGGVSTADGGVEKRVSERAQTQPGAGGDADNIVEDDDDTQAASGQLRCFTQLQLELSRS